MLYNKNNLAVVKCSAQTKGLRPALESVLFTNNKTVATDSFKIVEVSTPEIKDEFPEIPNKKALKDLEKPILLKAEQVADVKFFKKNKTLPILDNCILSSLDEKNYEITTTDLNKTNSVLVSKVDDNFPNYEPLFEDEKVKAEITINGQFLAELLEVLNGVNKYSHITLKIKDTKIELQTEGENNQKGRALLMAVRK